VIERRGARGWIRRRALVECENTDDTHDFHSQALMQRNEKTHALSMSSFGKETTATALSVNRGRPRITRPFIRFGSASRLDHGSRSNEVTEAP
jgi:hypothetical protein